MRRLAALTLMLGLTLAVGSSRPAALAQAPRGVAGPRGLPGPVGITWRGAYSGSTAYNPRDVVSYAGSAWICTGQTTGDTPPGTHWQTLAQGGAPTGLTWRGAYSGSATYQVGDGVSYNGQAYICVTAGTGNLPTGPAWNLLSSKGDAGPPGATGPAGAAGPSGSTWRNGSGTPSNALGTDGDYFLDVVLGDVYQRTAGVYNKVGNIKGPPGSGGGFTDTAYVDLRAPPYGANIAGTTNEDAIQAAIDSLLSTAPGGTLDGGQNSSQGIVYIPPGTWLTSRPVWLDADHISIVGRSSDTSIIQSLSGGPPVMVGLKRRTAWDRTRKGYLTFTGTLTFTNNSATVTGAGTNFATVLGPMAGSARYLTTDLVTFYPIASVNSETSITLAAPYPGATVTTPNGTNLGAIGYLETIPKVFAADHRKDMWNGGAPKLDSSMVTGANQRFSITSKSPTSGSPWPDHSGAFFLCPGPTGNEDCWEQTDQFTLELKIEAADSGKIGPCYITGMGADSGPSPWFLQTGDLLSGDKYTFFFRTKEGPANIRRFHFGRPDLATGPQGICIQADLRNGVFPRAWISNNGGPYTEQTVVGDYGMTASPGDPTVEPSYVPGMHFLGNEPGEPLCLWGQSPAATGFGSMTSLAQRGNFSILGYRMTSGLRYTSDGSSHQILAGGVTGTLNDDFRYNDAQDSARSFFCLDTTAPAVGDYKGKLIPMRGGPIRQTYYGVFLSPTFESQVPVCTYTNFERLRLLSGSHGGAALLITPTLHVTADRSYFGGWVGIGSAGGLATYDININRCEFVAPCAWVYGNSWELFLDHPKRSDIGRWAVIVDGCNSTIDCLLTSNSAANNRGAIKITGNSAYGFRTHIRKMVCDNEGSAVPDFLASVYAERGQGGAYLEIDDLGGGTIPAGKPVVYLADHVPAPPTNPAGVVRLRSVAGAGTVGVQTDGPGWIGTLEDVDPDSSPEWRRHLGADGTANVIAHLRLDTLPRAGVWQKNAVAVTLRHPAAASARDFLCVQSGTAQWDPATAYVAGQQVNYLGVNYTAAANSTNSTPGGGNPNWTAGAAGVPALWAPTTTLGTPRAA